MRLADRMRSAQLRNGAQVHLLESHRNLTVDLAGFIEGGLSLEDESLPGVAHLCVSMLDRGTGGRDQAAIADALESNGARLAYGLNPELLSFRARCLSEDLELVLEDIFDFEIGPGDRIDFVREGHPPYTASAESTERES